MTKSWHLLHSYCFTGGSWRTEPFSQTIIAPHEGQFIILDDNLKIKANISLFDINFHIVAPFYNLIRISLLAIIAFAEEEPSISYFTRYLQSWTYQISMDLFFRYLIISFIFLSRLRPTYQDISIEKHISRGRFYADRYICIIDWHPRYVIIL